MQRLLLPFALACACTWTSAPAGSTPAPAAVEPVAETPGPPEEPSAPQVESAEDDSPAGIEAVNVDGVWVFRHTPTVMMMAIHSGAPTVRDGCLYVDDTVVVWHAEGMASARAAIAAAGQTPPVMVRVPGGGVSLDEGASADSFAAVITERCPTRAIWYAAR